ncbi:glycosyltransferase [Grimontia sp. SpTr1]|uniref:glycosyltransferase n=1 Tax=Grimontia sp. SpTr1 TaxID=2995319 RepID=UPI00248B2EA0|nr:glycosyltransferase [Grimontia sp. SpTr1]
MIFVTVGSQMAFDRMVNIVDEWAKKTSRNDIVAQIGMSSEKFDNIDCYEGFTSEEFKNKIEQADVVIGHAGMGTILTCLEIGKPLLIMAREGSLKETRNDHQIATKNWVKDWDYIFEFHSIETLESAYNAAIAIKSLPTRNQHSESELVDFLKEVIHL